MHFDPSAGRMIEITCEPSARARNGRGGQDLSESPVVHVARSPDQQPIVPEVPVCASSTGLPNAPARAFAGGAARTVETWRCRARGANNTLATKARNVNSHRADEVVAKHASYISEALRTSLVHGTLRLVFARRRRQRQRQKTASPED